MSAKHSRGPSSCLLSMANSHGSFGPFSSPAVVSPGLPKALHRPLCSSKACLLRLGNPGERWKEHMLEYIGSRNRLPGLKGWLYCLTAT